MHAYSRWDRPYRLKGLTSHERVDIPGHPAPAVVDGTDVVDPRTDARTGTHHAARTGAAADRDPTQQLCGDAQADGQADRGGHRTCERPPRPEEPDRADRPADPRSA